MNILVVGDVVGSNGCDALEQRLCEIKRKYSIDFCVVNGENSADGNGIIPKSAEHIFSYGADVITTGNHVFRRREIYPMLDENEFLLRPANYPDNANGKGVCVYDMGKIKIGVVNIMGVVYMQPLADPFEAADKSVRFLKEQGCKIIVVDFHAEATAEKKALGFYLDGNASVVFGTHTHTQTADIQILPNGTGFITDVGMCGPYLSVLGVKPELAILKMRNKMPVRFENAGGDYILNGAVFTVNEQNGKCEKTQIISEIIGKNI